MHMMGILIGFTTVTSGYPMKLILASAQDQAAKNIATRMLELYDFEKLPTLRNAYVREGVTLMMVAGNVTQITEAPMDAEEIIVASRHASESGNPSLTVHVPGEPEKLELAEAAPSTIKTALETLVRVCDELGLPYDVSLEATHHGPTKLDVPVTFVEIGSSPEQWRDERAGEAVARAIMDAATSPSECHQALGLGGPHYAPRHTEVVLHTDVGIGHILPKYVDFDRELIERAIAHTRGGVELLALDWKGMSKEQKRISKQVAAALDIRVARVREILVGQSFKSTQEN